ncbi:olfactory receptor 6B1-like [Bufo gargarizans]|uniref:olfactory receptor 6B1-like n=1 Tax=Bufo gargarizans TaxID=30331 RepID=UPI001CF42340|nr:olfactory receptor 6B1-like [Bufo gargarizans]
MCPQLNALQATFIKHLEMKMHEVNYTTVTEFLILGFPALNDYKFSFFSIILLMYSMTICENLLIIFLVSTSQRLRSPMYFFLGHLALSDIVLVTTIAPKMLDVIIKKGSTVSYSGCLAQLYLYGVAVCAQCFLLTAMSYDRYLAICRPLHYISVMSIKLRYILLMSSWGLSFMLLIITLVFLCNLVFCGPNVINHFFCDFAPLLELSCSDATALSIDVLVLAVPLILIPFILIIISYVSIFITIFGISSISGRQKTFSTCSSHLGVVSTYYGSILIIYMFPYRGHSLTANKFISLLYIVLTPFLNPVIYSLRNKEIKSSGMNYLKLWLEKIVKTRKLI